jgi:hypothetical protein
MVTGPSEIIAINNFGQLRNAIAGAASRSTTLPDRENLTMSTFSIKLTDIAVKAYFPPNTPLEEQIIANGTGTLTVSDFSGGVHYYLQVDGGTRVNLLRMGEVVTASGKDPENRLVAPAEPLETVSVGTPALFRGPVRRSTPPAA